MRKSRIVAVAFAILLAGTAVEAQIAVEILHMPSEVPSFGPLFVLYSVENIGEEPIYLPAGRLPNFDGTALYSAPAGQDLRPPRRGVARKLFPHTIGSMWLAPGERWLYYEALIHELDFLESELSVQVVLSSKGRCGGTQVYGRESFPIEPLYIETLRSGLAESRVYRCWEGEVRSGVRNVTVRKPATAIDDAAFEYLVANEQLRQFTSGNDAEEEVPRWHFRFVVGFPERFPESHLAYAMLARHASTGAMRRAIELQPGHPLNPWVKGAMAQQILDARSSCWKYKPPPIDLDIEELELQDGVREYLEQYEWYLENRHCPYQLAEEQRQRELEERRRQESASDTDSDAGGGS